MKKILNIHNLLFPIFKRQAMKIYKNKEGLVPMTKRKFPFKSLTPTPLKHFQCIRMRKQRNGGPKRI